MGITNRIMIGLLGGWIGLTSLVGCNRTATTQPTGATGGGKAKVIAVIPKGLTHNHWKAVEAGAQKAAAESNGAIRIDWKGPPKEDDTSQQISLVENFVSAGVDGLVLAPLSDQALLSPVRLAVAAGIPVVIIDSALAGEPGKDFLGYVGTDNRNAGVLAGQRMAELAGPDGTVMVLRYAESSASTNEREQGFLAALHEAAPGVKVIDPPQYAGADVNSAKQAAENMITTYQGQFQGIFCPNESSTYGMLLALRDRQLAGKVYFVGFDVRKELFEALRGGQIHGLVIQNPFEMGYRSVKALMDHFAGQAVEGNIDTGAALVTPDNVDSPAIRAITDRLLKE